MNNKLSFTQKANHKRKCYTCTNILESLHHWCFNLQCHIPIDVVQFDFKKAFDSVLHPKLIMKQPAYGKSGNLLTWIADFFHMKLQVVKLKNIYSHIVSFTHVVFHKVVFQDLLYIYYLSMMSVTYMKNFLT